MAILKFGEHLPPTYLERFNPPENQVVRVSLLALQSVGVESHWVDLPTLGVKGMYRCTGGVCCSSGAFGRRSQYYHVPVYVYSNPLVNVNGQLQANPQGILMDWSLTKTIYDSLISLAERYNLLEYDLDVVKTVQGQGTRTNFTLVPDVKMRSYWTPEQTQQINESVQMFFQVADTTLVQDATDQTYMDMLTQAGYNFETKQFPQLAAPAYHGANVAISSAVLPPMGASRPQSSGLPGSFGAPSQAMPTPPQTGSPVTPQTGSPAPLNTGTMPKIQSVVPPQPSVGTPVQPQATTGTPQGTPVSQMGSATPQPVPQNATPQSTSAFCSIPNAASQYSAPNIPQANFGQMSPVPPVQGAPVASPVPQNNIPQAKATELSSEDIDALLGD